MSNHTPTCIHCEKDQSLVPLVVIKYKGGDFWICTEHFPILIHRPHDLTGKLPDAENIKPGEHD
jgi:hypothetical protein